MINVSGGNLTDIYVYCYSGSGASKAKIGVYSDVSGLPSALLADAR